MLNNLVVIGGGPTALYLLKHVVAARISLKISVIESSSDFGVGMPYSPGWVDNHHLANIACEEIPDLIDAPDSWIASQSDSWLSEHQILRAQIGPAYIPSRIVLGLYFKSQFDKIIRKAADNLIEVHCLQGYHVMDVLPSGEIFNVIAQNRVNNSIVKITGDRVALAMGHVWNSGIQEGNGYHPSPWPIANLRHDIGPVGLLGSSLSAADAAITFANMAGQFHRDFNGVLRYKISEPSSDFIVVLHSRRGLLPSLRFHFEYPRIQTHQHISASEIDQAIEEGQGRLDLDFVFERAVKQIIQEKNPDLYNIVKSFSLEQFATFIYQARSHEDPFDFLQKEFTTSQLSIYNKQPIYWKEILDDAAYTLNLYVKYLDQRDWQRMQDIFMPLVSHIVAFLPPPTTERLLALHDAHRIKSVAIGFEYTLERAGQDGMTNLTYRHPKSQLLTTLSYRTFVDCRGQEKLPFEAFPFASLIEAGVVTPANFGNNAKPFGQTDFRKKGASGVLVDDEFHPLNLEGKKNSSIFVLAAPFISGLYPYHSGLPFCNEVGKRVSANLVQQLAA